MAQEYIAQPMTGMGARNGTPAVYLGSSFICEARTLAIADKIAVALNSYEVLEESERALKHLIGLAVPVDSGEIMMFGVCRETLSRVSKTLAQWRGL